MNKRPRAMRGRRPGHPDTRAQILDVARGLFLTHGYQSVTMRTIAAEASVDAALISYFFGSKRGLFAASLALTASPPDVLRQALPGEPETMPERVVRALVTAWDDPQHGRPLVTAVEAAVGVQEVARLLREVVEREMIDQVAARLRGDDARGRAAAFAMQLGGLVFTRYILRVDPLATMSVDELVRCCTPGLRAALRSRPSSLPAARTPVHAAHGRRD